LALREGSLTANKTAKAADARGRTNIDPLGSIDLPRAPLDATGS
jgi:hypothetical protein